MSDEIYVALLDEGIDVWRPVPARKLDGDVYAILRPNDYDPDDEHWQFPPGSTVVCATKATSAGAVLAAVSLAKPIRQSV